MAIEWPPSSVISLFFHSVLECFSVKKQRRCSRCRIFFSNVSHCWNWNSVAKACNQNSWIINKVCINFWFEIMAFTEAGPQSLPGLYLGDLKRPQNFWVKSCTLKSFSLKGLSLQDSLRQSALLSNLRFGRGFLNSWSFEHQSAHRQSSIPMLDHWNWWHWRTFHPPIYQACSHNFLANIPRNVSDAGCLCMNNNGHCPASTVRSSGIQVSRTNKFWRSSTWLRPSEPQSPTPCIDHERAFFL